MCPRAKDIGVRSAEHEQRVVRRRCQVKCAGWIVDVRDSHKKNLIDKASTVLCTQRNGVIVLQCLLVCRCPLYAPRCRLNGHSRRTRDKRDRRQCAAKCRRICVENALRTRRRSRGRERRLYRTQTEQPVRRIGTVRQVDVAIRSDLDIRKTC